MTSVLPTRSSNRVTWWERIAHATMLPFKIMLVLCVGLAWLACRAVYATDEASGHHRPPALQRRWPPPTANDQGAGSCWLSARDETRGVMVLLLSPPLCYVPRGG